MLLRGKSYEPLEDFKRKRQFRRSVYLGDACGRPTRSESEESPLTVPRLAELVPPGGAQYYIYVVHLKKPSC